MDEKIDENCENIDKTNFENGKINEKVKDSSFEAECIII